MSDCYCDPMDAVALRDAGWPDFSTWETYKHALDAQPGGPSYNAADHYRRLGEICDAWREGRSANDVATALAHGLNAGQAGYVDRDLNDVA